MTIKLANNAISRLAVPLSSTDTLLSVMAGDGSRFPALTEGESFPLTLVKANGDIEIVRVTARTQDLMTIVRGQEGTQPNEFGLNDRVELRLTAGALRDLIDEVELTAPRVEFIPTPYIEAENVQAAIVEVEYKQRSGLATKLTATANLGDLQNAGVARDNLGLGSAATLDVSHIVPSGAIVMWSGAVNAIPGGWALCDGSNGTPNLTDRFIVAAGGDYAVGDTGDGSIPSHSHGSGTLAAASGGAHTHTASTGSAGAHGHTGSTNSAGAHTHTPGGGGAWSAGSMGGSPTVPSYNTAGGSAGAHSHTVTINSNGAHTHTVSVTSGGDHTHTISGSTAATGTGSEVIAKYYALAYIMKL